MSGRRDQPFGGPTSVASVPIQVVIDGSEFASGLVTMRTYGREPENLTVRRYAAAVRAELLELAHAIAVQYGIDSDHLEEIMNAGNGASHDDIDIRFEFHTAAGKPEVGERHDYVRYLCRELGHALVDQLPEGRDKALALTALEDVMMRSNRAIAIAYRDVPAAPPPIPRPVPRPPASAYEASRPAPVYRSQTPTRGAAVPKPRPAADDAGGKPA